MAASYQNAVVNALLNGQPLPSTDPSIGVTTQPTKIAAPSPFTPSPNAPTGQITPTLAQAQDASNGGVGIDNNGSVSGAMPSGIDPALAAIYQKAGVTPGDRGTGFADWQYWQGVGPSQYSRLASDIAGTGPDQTTGTPWAAGAWQNSGRGGSQPSASGAPAIPLTLGAGLNPILQGDANSNIANALQSVTGQNGIGTQNYLQSLIASLGGAH